VSEEIIEKLTSLDNTKIIFKSGDLQMIKPMMWRFEAIDDPNVEVMMSRDTDTRIWLREKLAVNEWLHSDKLFHIMRDHPHHQFCILGGMFGTKKIPQIPSWINLIDQITQYTDRDYDQTFLKDFIYPIIKNNAIIHATFNKMENNANNFPISYDNDLKFVGEYVYFDDSRSQEHINILRNHITP
jgi:hypothetical protein